MRLIHIAKLQIHEFLGPPPPYAILSHTWEEGEVTFHDVSEKIADGKPGWLKVTSFCRIVNHYLREPVEYVWVDTCCIDKSSSAETSEAINSMFRYYKEATYCFVYLADVVCDNFGEFFQTVFVDSRWFTRGWTLQELIAPPELMFFDMNWEYIGTKIDLAAFISEKTKVDMRTLISGDWPGASIARRMSWASTRQTTRPEDMAYCLLGLFGVHMPLIYGEGSRAFVRLQEEILKESDDYSILAWDASGVGDYIANIGVLATHPILFKDSGSIESYPAAGSMSISNLGIQTRLSCKKNGQGQMGVYLPCSSAGDVDSVIVLDLDEFQQEPRIFGRARSNFWISSTNEILRSEEHSEFYLLKTSRTLQSRVIKCCLTYENSQQMFPIRWYPDHSWAYRHHTRSMTLTLPVNDETTLKAAVVFWCRCRIFEGFYVLVLTLSCNQNNGVVQLKEVSDGRFPEKLEEMIESLPAPAEGNRSTLGTDIMATINARVIRGVRMFSVTVTQPDWLPPRQ